MEVRQVVKEARYDLTDISQIEFEMIRHGLNYIRTYVVSGDEAKAVDRLREKVNKY